MRYVLDSWRFTTRRCLRCGRSRSCWPAERMKWQQRWARPCRQGAGWCGRWAGSTALAPEEREQGSAMDRIHKAEKDCLSLSEITHETQFWRGPTLGSASAGTLCKMLVLAEGENRLIWSSCLAPSAKQGKMFNRLVVQIQHSERRIHSKADFVDSSKLLFIHIKKAHFQENVFTISRRVSCKSKLCTFYSQTGG